MTDEQHYTFGDGDDAMTRLVLLGEAFAQSSRAWLASLSLPRARTVVDLGCGPGLTTALLRERFAPEELYGIDQSERLVARARSKSEAGADFVVHDLTRGPLPVPPADVLYVRFLLTHLANPGRVLELWATAVVPGGRLLVEEDTLLRSEHPSFARYYELVEALQAHYGQNTYVGRRIPELVRDGPWEIEQSDHVDIELDASTMARLHALNLRTWSRDPYARAAFDADELAGLGRVLESVAGGEPAPPVFSSMAKVVLVARQGDG